MEVIKGREVSWGWIPKSHSREAEGPVLEHGSHHSVLSESVPGRGVAAGARDPGAGERVLMKGEDPLLSLQRSVYHPGQVPLGKHPGMGEPDGLPSMGSHRVGHD